MNKAAYLKIAYRDHGSWKTETYRTDDPQWREAFRILQATFPRVRILYI